MEQLGRTRQGFPSRQYRYPYAVPSDVQMDEAAVPAAVLQFIAGRDATPTPLTREEVRARLHDPFARLVLDSSASPPLSLRALMARLDASPLTEQRSFVVADGGQIAWSPETDTLQRNFRLAITRQAPAASQPDILISASTDIDSPTNFLQVIGWDDTSGAYQFYERRNGRWVWAGSSWDALLPGSRGAGPFDSHINGALNLKELKFPWLHWHSPSAAISDEVLAPDDPLRGEPVWTGRCLADEFGPSTSSWRTGPCPRMSGGPSTRAASNGMWLRWRRASRPPGSSRRSSSWPNRGGASSANGRSRSFA